MVERRKCSFCGNEIEPGTGKIYAKKDGSGWIKENVFKMGNPAIVVDSLGTNVADTIIEARKERKFISKQDVKNRTKLSTTLFSKLDDLNVFEGMIEKNQMSLFDL